MTRLLVALLVVVALLGTLVLWSAGSSAPPATTGDVAGRGETSSSGLGASTTSDRGTASDPVVRQSLPPDEGEGGATDAVAGDAVLHVRVVGEGGAPVADAQVFVPPPDDASNGARQAEQRSSTGPGLDPGEYAERFGQAYRTDLRGRVDVPRPRRAESIAAAAAGAFGVATYDGGTDALEITLERDTTLTVEVRTQNGEPAAAVLVAVRMRYAGREGPASKWLGRTGEDGRLVCRHFQRMVVTIVRQERGRPEAAEVIVKEPGLDAPGVAIDLDTPPPQPVVLTLPPYGSVVVRVQDGAGEPLAQDCTVELVALPLPETVFERLRAKERAVVQAGASEHTFAFVGLGARLQLTARVGAVDLRASGPSVEADGTVRGPQRTGEAVTVTFTVSDDAPTLCGTAEDREGQPVTDRLDLHLTLGARDRIAQTTPDAQGRFTVVLDEARVGQRLTALRTDLRSGDDWLLGMADLDLVVAAGRNDVGTLVLVPSPLLVAGTVVDEGGRPVDDAEIRIRTVSDEAQEHASIWTRLGWPPPLRRLPGGGFECYGVPPAAPAVLEVGKSGYQSAEPIPFEPGQTGVRVVLRGIGRLETVVRTDPALEFWALKGLLRAEDGGEQWCDHGGMRDGIRLHAEPLAPGLYDLELWLAGDRQPMLRLASLRVRAGETCDDPRLQELDLRGRVRFLTLDVVAAADGAPVTEARLQLHDPIGRRHHARFQGSGATWKVPYDGETRDLEVTAKGFVGQRVQIDNDTTVRLGAVPRVGLRLATPAGSTGGRRIEVRVAEKAGAGATGDEARNPLRVIGEIHARDHANPILTWPTRPDAVEGDRSLFRLAAGEYDVAVFVVDEAKTHSVRVDGVTPATIEVLEDAGEHEFVLHVPPAAWSSAFAAMDALTR